MLSDKQREVREKRIRVVLRCLVACAPVLMGVVFRLQSRGWASLAALATDGRSLGLMTMYVLAVWFFAGILLSERGSDA
jgi:hypothetical protein